jgi:cell division protease FtsH
MSEELGPIAYDESSEQIFLGRDYTRRQTHSEKTLQAIDAEVKRIINEQLARAREILDENKDKVETMTAALLERESLERSEVDLIMRGEPLPEPEITLPPSSAPVGGDHEKSAAASEEGSDVTAAPQNPDSGSADEEEARAGADPESDGSAEVAGETGEPLVTDSEDTPSSTSRQRRSSDLR